MATLREALCDREPVCGTWVSIGHPAVAELSAELGFDFVLIDTEHTSTGIDRLEELIRAVDAAEGDAAPLVRVPWNDPVRIKRALDAGAAGLMVPMIETGEDAEAAVEAMRYPPEGIRGTAPSRASAYGRRFEEYFEAANDELVTIVQVESAEGVENAAAIAAVEGVDAVLVGHGDLSASIGAFGEWDGEAFQEALGRIVEAAHAEGTPVGMLALSDEDIRRWTDAGVDFLIVGADISYITEGAADARETFEEIVRGRE